MKSRKVKRKQWIVEPAFQYGMIRKIACMAALLIIMALSFLTWVNVLYGDLQFELVQPDPFGAAAAVGTLSARPTLIDLLWPVMGACVVLTVAATFFFGIIISHRMAGPVFRIRRELQQAVGGDLRGDVILRKADDFKSLAGAVNAWKTSMRTVVRALRDVQRGLQDSDATVRSAALESLARIVSGFKTD